MSEFSNPMATHNHQPPDCPNCISEEDGNSLIFAEWKVKELIAEALSAQLATIATAVEKAHWKLFNSDWSNQTERGTEKRQVLNEAHKVYVQAIEEAGKNG